MPTNHHHLILQRRVSARNLGHCIEAMLMIARELGLDIHLHRHRHMMLHHARQPIVVLNHHHAVRNVDGILASLHTATEIGAIVVEDDPGAPTTAAVARRRDNHGGVLSQDYFE